MLYTVSALIVAVATWQVPQGRVPTSRQQLTSALSAAVAAQDFARASLLKQELANDVAQLRGDPALLPASMLYEALDDAVAHERYSAAAAIRDEIDLANRLSARHSTRASVPVMMADDADAKAKAAKAKAAKAKAAPAKAKAAKAAKKEGDEEETPEEKAAREAEEKAKAEAEAKKKAEEAKKKAEAAAKKKAEEEAKALAQKNEAIACFSDARLVLTKTGQLNPPPATVNERADYLRAEGLDEKNIQAAMTECGVKEVMYKRDAWGRIISFTDTKYNDNATPPPADSFGQLRPRDD